MVNGEAGAAMAWAIQQQMAAGQALGATRLRPIRSVHAGAEIGTMGDAGLEHVEWLVEQGARSCVPTSTAACSVDFARAAGYGVSLRQIEREQRLHRALARFGVIDVSTCINYQTLTPPRFGEHLAWGDTGAVAFANGVAGARSNYEGGPAALAAAITGLAPDYGYHQAEARLASDVVEVSCRLEGTADWSALGAWMGTQLADYWRVPAIVLNDGQAAPSVDELKHFAAAAASFGSIAMFHIVGVTPEAATLDAACGHRRRQAHHTVTRSTLGGLFSHSLAVGDKIDLVVFSAPQLSLGEVQMVLARLGERSVAPGTRLILTVNAQVEAEMRRLGWLERLEQAGGGLLTGTCFYVMAPRDVRRHLGATTLLTPSAKLVNILSGAGYRTGLATLDACLDAAVSGYFA